MIGGQLCGWSLGLQTAPGSSGVRVVGRTLPALAAWRDDTSGSAWVLPGVYSFHVLTTRSLAHTKQDIRFI